MHYSSTRTKANKKKHPKQKQTKNPQNQPINKHTNPQQNVELTDPAKMQ